MELQWAIKAFAADCSADWMNESVWIMLDCNHCNLALNLSFACPRPVGSSYHLQTAKTSQSQEFADLLKLPEALAQKVPRTLLGTSVVKRYVPSHEPEMTQDQSLQSVCHWSLNRWDQCSPISGFLFTTSGPANLNSASRSRGPTRSTAETCQNIKNNFKFWSLTVQSCLLATGQNPTTCRVNWLSRTNCSRWSNLSEIEFAARDDLVLGWHVFFQSHQH